MGVGRIALRAVLQAARLVDGQGYDFGKSVVGVQRRGHKYQQQRQQHGNRHNLPNLLQHASFPFRPRLFARGHLALVYHNPPPASIADFCRAARQKHILHLKFAA